MISTLRPRTDADSKRAAVHATAHAAEPAVGGIGAPHRARPYLLHLRADEVWPVPPTRHHRRSRGPTTNAGSWHLPADIQLALATGMPSVCAETNERELDVHSGAATEVSLGIAHLQSGQHHRALLTGHPEGVRPRRVADELLGIQREVVAAVFGAEAVPVSAVVNVRRSSGRIYVHAAGRITGRGGLGQRLRPWRVVNRWCSTHISRVPGRACCLSTFS